MPDARESALLQQQLCELLRLIELRTFRLSPDFIARHRRPARYNTID